MAGNVYQQLTDLFQSVQKGFGVLANQPTAIENTIARVMAGSGQRVRMKFSPVANAPKRREEDETRKVARVAWFDSTIEHQIYGPDSVAELYDVLDSDPAAMSEFMDHVAAFVQTAPRVWRNILAEVMSKADGTTLGACYNKGPLLSANMPINPDRPTMGVQPNFITGLAAFDAAAIKQILGLFTEMKGHDGQRLWTGARKLVCVVPNDEINFAIRNVIQGSVIPQPVGANAAVGVDNQLKGVFDDVILFPELNSYNTKRIHVLNVADPIQRAYALSIVRQPTPYLKGLDPKDEQRTQTFGGRIEAGWDCFGGAGYGLPQAEVAAELA